MVDIAPGFFARLAGSRRLRRSTCGAHDYVAKVARASGSRSAQRGATFHRGPNPRRSQRARIFELVARRRRAALPRGFHPRQPDQRRSLRTPGLDRSPKKARARFSTRSGRRWFTGKPRTQTNPPRGTGIQCRRSKSYVERLWVEFVQVRLPGKARQAHSRPGDSRGPARG